MIDEADKAGYKLYVEENANGEIDPFMSYQNLFLKRFDEGNTEILFARPSSDYGSYEKHATPTASGGSGGLGVTQSLVDAFFMQDGLPYDGSNEEGFSESDVKLDNTIWDEEVNGGAVTYAGTYNMYCNREPRFYVSVAFNNSYFPTEKRKFEFLTGRKTIRIRTMRLKMVILSVNGCLLRRMLKRTITSIVPVLFTAWEKHF